jgi:hypothetical protein
MKPVTPYPPFFFRAAATTSFFKTDPSTMVTLAVFLGKSTLTFLTPSSLVRVSRTLFSHPTPQVMPETFMVYDFVSESVR